MLESLLNKVAGLQTFLITPILKNICKLLLLHLRYYTPANNTTEAAAKSEADLGLLQHPAIS